METKFKIKKKIISNIYFSRKYEEHGLIENYIFHIEFYRLIIYFYNKVTMTHQLACLG